MQCCFLPFLASLTQGTCPVQDEISGDVIQEERRTVFLHGHLVAAFHDPLCLRLDEAVRRAIWKFCLRFQIQAMGCLIGQDPDLEAILEAPPFPQ